MDKKKEKYEAPTTTRVRVEVESGICASSITITPKKDVGTDNHVSIEKQGAQTFDFSSDNWD